MRKIKQFWPYYLILISIGCGYFANYIFSMKNDPNLSIDKSKLLIEDLKNKFPSLQQSLLKKLRSAFMRLKTNGEPCIFLLIHDDTNKNTTDCITSSTSILAKKYIFTNTMKSLWINASEWIPYSDPKNENLLHEKVIL